MFSVFCTIMSAVSPQCRAICRIFSLTLLQELHLYLIPLWNFFQYLADEMYENVDI